MLSAPGAFHLCCKLSKGGSCFNQMVGTEHYISWGWRVVHFRRAAWKKQFLTHRIGGGEEGMKHQR